MARARGWAAGALALTAAFAVAGAAPAQGQSGGRGGGQAGGGAQRAAPLDPNEALWTLYTDKNGGYRAKNGGYYDPNKGTYTDKEGGVVDNWKGYTYTDGSYKLNGDYYDAAKRILFFAGPKKEQADVKDYPPAQVIKTMRDNAAERGLYDKDFIRKGMYQAIKDDHRIDPDKVPPRSH